MNIMAQPIGNSIVTILIAFYRQFAAVSVTIAITNIKSWICSNSIMTHCGQGIVAMGTGRYGWKEVVRDVSTMDKEAIRHIRNWI